jgi:hypothetical protein
MRGDIAPNFESPSSYTRQAAFAANALLPADISVSEANGRADVFQFVTVMREERNKRILSIIRAFQIPSLRPECLVPVPLEQG